jgi:hypothetical protein
MFTGTNSDLRVAITLLKVVDPAKPVSKFSGACFCAREMDKRYAAFQLRLVNSGDFPVEISPSSRASATDGQGQEFVASHDGVVEPAFGRLPILAGDEQVGFVTVQVPKDSELRSFELTLEDGASSQRAKWVLR